jgi:DtxR family Mn-dependent transcriptional regulator
MLALATRECKFWPQITRIRWPFASGSLSVAEWHDTTEEYLEAILEIEEEGTIPIRARLVERLGLSAPAVSETVNRLVEHGYAELLDDRTLRLTDKGRAVATSIVRRHRLAERLLVDIIGLEWEKVHKEADRWEHAISADVEEKLVLLLGDPATCPHGNPIPGSSHRVEGPASTPLSQMAPGPVIVRRISEKVEIDDAAIAFLASAELTPGSNAVVVGTNTEGVQVTCDTGAQVVPKKLAQLVYVVPA